MPPNRKAPTNLSLRRDLVEHAKTLKINLSEVLEGALVAAICDKERAAWVAENRDAIDEYNERVERDEVFGDDWRKF